MQTHMYMYIHIHMHMLQVHMYVYVYVYASVSVWSSEPLVHVHSPLKQRSQTANTQH